MIEEFKAVYTIWLREVLAFLRDKPRIISSILTPLFFFLVLGTGLGASVKMLTPAFENYEEFIIPGIIGMNVLFSSIGSGLSVIMDREFGFMKEMLIAPVSRVSIVIGKSLGGSTTTVIQSILITIFAMFLGFKLTFIHLLMFLPIIIILSVGIICSGIILACIVKSSESFHLLSNLIVTPMFLLSGAIFPLENLPAWLAFITSINPLSYGVDLIRGAFLNHTSFNPLVSLFVTVIFSVVSVLVASVFFSRRD